MRMAQQDCPAVFLPGPILVDLTDEALNTLVPIERIEVSSTDQVSQFGIYAVQRIEIRLAQTLVALFKVEANLRSQPLLLLFRVH
jgi:hypothetical protein